MLRFPRTTREWIVATVSALSGFFFGGAAVALAQRTMKRILSV